MKALHKTLFLLCLSSSIAGAQTTVTYAYDELGRVKAATDSVNGDRNYEYDDAGNRKKLVVGTIINQVPVAKNDSVSARPLYKAFIVNVLANDSDPDSDPITITTFTNNNPSIASVRRYNDTSLEVVGVYSGSGTAKYTISDGKGGTATAVLYISVSAN